MSIKFHATYPDISSEFTVGVYTLVNLSGYGVPSNASYALLRITGGDSNTDGIRCRKPGGSISGISTDMLSTSHRWMYAPVVNQEVEVLREHSSVGVFLDGWVEGNSWVGLATPQGVGTLTGNTWNTIDSSSYAPNAKAIIFEYDSGSWQFDIRPNGSTHSGTQQGGLQHGWGIIGCDNDQKWQIYPVLWGGAVLLNLKVTGYITGECEFLTNPGDISLGVTGSYENIDITSYLTTHGYDAAIVMLHGTLSGVNFDARPVGSSRNWQRTCDNRNWFIVGLNAAEQFEGYIGNLALDFYLWGVVGKPAARSQAHIIG